MDPRRRIHDIMVKKGWNVGRLSEETGLTQTTIRNWFTYNKYFPNMKAVNKVCEAFQITKAQLFEEDGDSPYDKDRQEIIDYWVLMSPVQREAVLTVIRSYFSDCDDFEDEFQKENIE